MVVAQIQISDAMYCQQEREEGETGYSCQPWRTTQARSSATSDNAGWPCDVELEALLLHRARCSSATRFNVTTPNRTQCIHLPLLRSQRRHHPIPESQFHPSRSQQETGVWTEEAASARACTLSTSRRLCNPDWQTIEKSFVLTQPANPI
jgi:hypothetical protein